MPSTFNHYLAALTGQPVQILVHVAQTHKGYADVKPGDQGIVFGECQAHKHLPDAHRRLLVCFDNGNAESFKPYELEAIETEPTGA